MSAPDTSDLDPEVTLVDITDEPSDANSDKSNEEAAASYRELKHEEWTKFKATVSRERSKGGDKKADQVGDTDKDFLNTVLKKYTRDITWKIAAGIKDEKTVQGKFLRKQKYSGWNAAFKELFESRNLTVDLGDAAFVDEESELWDTIIIETLERNSENPRFRAVFLKMVEG